MVAISEYEIGGHQCRGAGNLDREISQAIAALTAFQPTGTIADQDDVIDQATVYHVGGPIVGDGLVASQRVESGGSRRGLALDCLDSADYCLMPPGLERIRRPGLVPVSVSLRRVTTPPTKVARYPEDPCSTRAPPTGRSWATCGISTPSRS